ncbi:MAG: sugar ABC transporter permease [Phycisphaerae bacterium]|nr:sugar ABC transporter permease [Phycisphaerae bacterium]
MLLAMAGSLLLSMVEWDGVAMSGMRWVGLDNYRAILTLEPGKQDRDFWIALYNSLTYAVFAVPLGLAGSLVLALMLNQAIRGISFFRTLYYLPHVLGGVATIMIWRWIFHPEFGLLNAMIRDVYGLLAAAGLEQAKAWPVPGWLYSATWSKPSMLVMSLWGAGGAMLIFLAALQNVPEHLYEAARIDGAGRTRCFWHVTLPQISPAMFFNLIMGIIATLQIFHQAYLLQAPGQKRSLLFYVLYLYRRAFEHYEMGYASALAWILFAIIMALTAVVLITGRYWVYYEGER